jgi:hypothetical protein
VASAKVRFIGPPTLLLSSSLLLSESDPESDVEVSDEDAEELSTSARFPSSLESSARKGGGGGGGGGSVLDELGCLPIMNSRLNYSTPKEVKIKIKNGRQYSTGVLFPSTEKSQCG